MHFWSLRTFAMSVYIIHVLDLSTWSRPTNKCNNNNNNTKLSPSLHLSLSLSLSLNRRLRSFAYRTRLWNVIDKSSMNEQFISLTRVFIIHSKRLSTVCAYIGSTGDLCERSSVSSTHSLCCTGDGRDQTIGWAHTHITSSSSSSSYRPSLLYIIQLFSILDRCSHHHLDSCIYIVASSLFRLTTNGRFSRRHARMQTLQPTVFENTQYAEIEVNEMEL